MSSVRAASRLLRPIWLAAVLAVGAAPFLLAILTEDRSVDFRLAKLDAALIVTHQIFDPRSTKMIQQAIDNITSRFMLQAAQVNESYDNDKINVYAIDFEKTHGLTFHIAGQAKRNFITISPNLIFLDAEYLFYLTADFFDHLGKNLEIWLHRKKGALFPFDDQDIRRSRMAKTMLSYGNADVFFEGKTEEYTQAIIEDYERLSTYTDEQDFLSGELFLNRPLLDNLLYVLYYDFLNENGFISEDFHYESLIEDTLEASLVFIILHEYGHLDASSNGGFVNGPLNVANETEREADNFAQARLESYFNATSRDSENARLLKSGVRSVADNLLDTVFARTLVGVRGFDAQKHGHFIIYSGEECNDVVRGFFDLNYIADIVPVLMPIYTIDEEVKLRNAIEQFISRSHGSQIVRSDVLSSSTYSDLKSPLLFSEPKVDSYHELRKVFLTALTNYDRSRMSEVYAQQLKEFYGELYEIGVPLRSIVNLNTLTRREPAVCPAERCQIYESAESDVRLEVIYTKGESPSYIRYTISELFPRDQIHRNTARQDSKVAAIYSRRLNVLKGLASGIGAESIDEALGQFIEQLAHCGFSSQIIEHNGITVRASTLGNWYEVQVEVYGG